MSHQGHAFIDRRILPVPGESVVDLQTSVTFGRVLPLRILQMPLEFVPERKRLFIAGNVLQMFVVKLLVFLIIPGFRHPVQQPPGRREIRTPDIKLRRGKHLRGLRRGNIKYTEYAENDQQRDPHHQNFPADLGARVRDVAVEKQKIEKRDGNFIGIHQHAFLPPEFVAIDKSSVDTAEIANPGFPVFSDPNFGMMAGYHIVADHDIILRI